MGTVNRRLNGDTAINTSEAAIRELYSPAPFSTDPLAVEVNKQTDYSIRITLDEAESSRARRRVRVYADGIYDMFHFGHARQLMQIKQLVPDAYLIVAVYNDELTQKFKGQTVMNETERYEAVRHCRYVDEVVRDAPWTITEEFLKSLKIDLVAHDDLPYPCVDGDPYERLKSQGILLVTQRTEGISTTDLIARIIRHYDVYIRRNLGRGCSREDLNVSYLRVKQIEATGKVKQLKAQTNDMLSSLEECGCNFVQNFVKVFTNPKASLVVVCLILLYNYFRTTYSH